MFTYTFVFLSSSPPPPPHELITLSRWKTAKIFRDDESEEYFEQEIAETNKDNGIQKLEENQNSYAHSIEEETELNTDDEIEVQSFDKLLYY